MVKSKKFLSIMFIPHSQRSTKSLRISYPLFSCLIGILCLLLVTSTLFLIKYHDFRRTLRANKKLAEEVTEFKQAMKVVGELEAKLRIMTDTEKEGIATGGPTEERLSNLLKYIEEKPTLALEDVRALQRQAVLQAKSLEELSQILEGQTIQLAHTPSVNPITGRAWITSLFGMRRDPFTKRQRMHEGLDLAARPGTPVIATADGRVRFSGKKGTWGNVVIIDHGYGFETRYAHNRRNLVAIGQEVKRYDQIAELGSSGRTTGPHVHYEVNKLGKPVNPMLHIVNLEDIGRESY
ncbi:M23 family metallopeptidase [bacterium]|nr:M23 family metallopeptidase [bacterium]MCG2677736.1 M23 family metallopeptidase [bacterium]